MPSVAILCFAAAFLLAVVAVIHQLLDIDPDYGNTMGGEMVTNHLWLLASLCCAAGSLGFLVWYVSLLVAVAVYGLSWCVRWFIEKISTPSH